MSRRRGTLVLQIGVVATGELLVQHKISFSVKRIKKYNFGPTLSKRLGKRIGNIGCWDVQEITNKIHILPEEITAVKIEVVLISEMKVKGNEEEETGIYFHF